jgi:DNA-binding SARP family transcriptional activator
VVVDVAVVEPGAAGVWAHVCDDHVAGQEIGHVGAHPLHDFVARRPFLADFDAPWIDQRRRALHEIHTSALECIGAAGLGLGGSELAAAERSGRALVELEPYRESGYALLMRARGNTAEALRTYEHLRQLLRTEFATAPGSELQAIHKRLLRGRPAPAAPN